MKCSTRLTPISWNTRDFLLTTLARLKDTGVLRHWAAVPHKGEYDLVTSETEKDHWHLLLILAGEVDVDVLLREFDEPDPTNPKPLGAFLSQEVLNAKARNEHTAIASWMLYGIHDKDFLLARGEERQFHYAWSDIVVDDKEWFNALRRFYSRRFGQFADLRRPRLEVVTEMVMAGEWTVEECLRKGWIPPVVARSLWACVRDQAEQVERLLAEKKEAHRQDEEKALIRAKDAELKALDYESRAAAMEARLNVAEGHYGNPLLVARAQEAAAFLDTRIAQKEDSVKDEDALH